MHDKAEPIASHVRILYSYASTTARLCLVCLQKLVELVCWDNFTVAEPEFGKKPNAEWLFAAPRSSTSPGYRTPDGNRNCSNQI